MCTEDSPHGLSLGIDPRTLSPGPSESPVTALFTSRPELKAQGLMVVAGPRTWRSLPRLVAGERVWSGAK